MANLDPGPISDTLLAMIADDLKNCLEALPPEERHELFAFLTKSELEGDHDYWETIRRRMDDESPEIWIPADQL
jgi:hypothetical protein